MKTTNYIEQEQQALDNMSRYAEELKAKCEELGITTYLFMGEPVLSNMTENSYREIHEWTTSWMSANMPKTEYKLEAVNMNEWSKKEENK